jgi:putative transposase
MERRFPYLVAVMAWQSRTVLSRRLSISLASDFCAAALEEAMNRYMEPEISITDQELLLTGLEFTQALYDVGVSISMDEMSRWMGNNFIERL